MISLKSSKYPARARKIAWINKLNKFMNKLLLEELVIYWNEGSELRVCKSVEFIKYRNYWKCDLINNEFCYSLMIL